MGSTSYGGAISDLDRAEEMLWVSASRIRDTNSTIREVEQIDGKFGLNRGAISRSQFGFPYASPELLYLDRSFRAGVRSRVFGIGRNLHGHFVEVYFALGMTKWVISDGKGAIEAFGRLLEVDRSDFGLGILYYLIEDIALARESLLASLRGSKREQRDYVEIWLWFTSVHLGHLDEANARIREHFFGKSRKGKPTYAHQITRFLLQEIEFSQLVDSADADDPVIERGQLCEAAFYSAQIALLMKDMEESVKLLLDKCLATGVWYSYEYKAAAIQKVVLSERLGKKVEAD